MSAVGDARKRAAKREAAGIPRCEHGAPVWTCADEYDALSPQNLKPGGMVGKMVDPYHRATTESGDGYAINLCGCAGGPHLGARKAGTPCCCEKCGYMTREQHEVLGGGS